MGRLDSIVMRQCGARVRDDIFAAFVGLAVVVAVLALGAAAESAAPVSQMPTVALRRAGAVLRGPRSNPNAPKAVVAALVALATSR